MQGQPISEKEVLEFLKRKGFEKEASALEAKLQVEQSLEELAFEAGLDVDISQAKIVSHSGGDTRLDETYSQLRDWIHGSLDRYKHELIAVMYPLFIHCYLDLVAKGHIEDAKEFADRHIHEHKDIHGDEINRVLSVTTRQHLEENEVTKKWRSNRFNVKMCRYSYNLLIGFLEQSKFMALLGLVNQYLNIKVFTGEPEAWAKQEYDAITGASAEETESINRKEIHWGQLEEISMLVKHQEAVKEEEHEGEEKGKEESAAPESEKEKEKEKGKKKEGPASKKIKTEHAPSTTTVKTMRSMIPLPHISDHMEVKMLEDLRSRVTLGATALPSICFYTLLNTEGSANTIELTKDGGMVAAGFADSSVKLWDLKKDHARIFGTSTARAHKRKTDYIPLIGHSGPVYSCSFSPDDQFLLTGSEDSTARLWNIETRSNVVCYKGHNYPVWSVDFSKLGYYFATASHDRTARLWSTDHIYPLRIFAGHLSDVDCVKFHPNCNYVATGSSDKSIRLWEVNSGACVRIFTGHLAAIYALAFSPDGRYLASAGEDQTIIIWDLAAGKKWRSFSGYHEKTIWSLDYSAEGTLLASGAADETVRLWNMTAEEGEAEKEPQDPAKPVKKTKKASDRTPKELLKTFKTKRTPVHTVKFTGKNLLLASGAFSSD